MFRCIQFMISVVIFFILSNSFPTDIFAKIQGAKSVASLKKTMLFDPQQLDINNIAAWFSNDGILFSDPGTGQSGLYYPRGASHDHAIIYTAGLWVIGKVNGDLRSAATCYSTEFQPGLILPNGAADDALNPRYRIFKFDRNNWDIPVMASDRAEAISQGMEDRMYGDQMLFYVFNDQTDHKNVWTTLPIGLEVHLTAFAFRRIRSLENTIFIKYEFINKGKLNLTDTYVAQFFDPDLGQSNDDGIGLDTTLSVGYVYNVDNDDDVYRERTPCFGCDLLQGPIIPSPGDRALVPGSNPLIDYKILPMTAFAAYLGAGPTGMSDVSLQTSRGAQMAYWYCSGLRSDGSPWRDPSNGNRVTRWPFSGDPVTGQGWIQKLTWPGADMRMCLSSGPFTLEVGKTYSMLVACVVGQGSDNLNSIQVMRKNDLATQLIYENNFITAQPAALPNIQVGQLDRKITFSWDDAAVKYSFLDKFHLDSTGQPTYYTFQGFKFYQAPSSTGPWKLLNQWDKADGVTRIWDEVYDPVWGDYLYTPVEDGKDTGLNFNLVLERDLLKDKPLINGKPYYFALTTYSYNPQGSPKVLENEIQCITVIPQKPVLGTELSSAPFDTLKYTRTGPGSGKLMTQVINPALITGHDYRLTFKYDDAEQISWDLFDIEAGWYVLNNQTHQSEEYVYYNDDTFLSADGFLIKVITRKSGLKEYLFEPEANRWLTAMNSDRWKLEGYGRFVGWGKYFEMGSSLGASQLRNIELRFAGCDTTGNPLDPRDVNISWAYRYLDNAGEPANPKFAEFIINTGYGSPYQDMRPIIVSAWDIDANPPRRLALAFRENNEVSGKVDGKWFPGRHDTEGGNNTTREILYILASDYSTTPKSEYTSKNLLDTQPMDIMWVCTAGRRGPRVPQSGDKLIIYPQSGNSPADTFLISTADAVKKTGNDIAKKRLNEINVFPNPYFATNTAEKQFYDQFVTFSNLPEKCIIRIFTLSGQMMRSLVHDNGTPFEKWDLTNEERKPVGSGMYIVLIQIDGVGEKILKLAIINREARYQHM
jgi:hypothetical protein